MAATAELLGGIESKLSDITTRLEKSDQRADALEKLVKEKSAPAYPAGGAEAALGVPWARRGEDPLSSRGYSFLKMIGHMGGHIKAEDCKVEREVHEKLHKSFVSGPGSQQSYRYTGNLNAPHFLAPLATAFMPESMLDAKTAYEVKCLVRAGTDGADVDEARRLSALSNYGKKDMSWLIETSGGALVPPPEYGEVISLLRNREALVNAGARTVPLPPQGRIVYPRVTSPTTAYWIGESQSITESDVGTGQAELSAKKLAVRTILPNELIRFASPAAEAVVRDDMAISLALGLDLAGLEGVGTSNTPKGIINYAGISTVTSTTTGGTGDTLVGQDLYRMVAAVEQNNATFEAFVMAPKTMWALAQLRLDQGGGAGTGAFMFDMMRALGQGVAPMVAGYPVIKSNQVSKTRTKGGSATNTYILGGMFSDVLIGMFGAIEFAAASQGDTMFAQDQTVVRAILSCDVTVRREAGLVLLDTLAVADPA